MSLSPETPSLTRPPSLASLTYLLPPPRSYSMASTVSRTDSQCSCMSCSARAHQEQPRPRKSRVHEAGVGVKDHYRLADVLGEGTFSTVYLAESLADPGGWAAAKVIDKNCLLSASPSPSGSSSELDILASAEDMRYLVAKEAQILGSLDHPHIVHLNEVFDDDQHVCFVMELAKVRRKPSLYLIFEVIRAGKSLIA